MRVWAWRWNASEMVLRRSGAGDAMIVNGERIRVLAERDPAKLPWGDLAVDVVLERSQSPFAGPVELAALHRCHDFCSAQRRRAACRGRRFGGHRLRRMT